MNNVQRPDGTPVDFRDVKAWGVIDSYWMPYQDFAELPEVFCQRNTEARLSKARKHLAVLLPEHCIVFVAKLTQDDELQGQRFRAGYRWRIDSNTRALNWSTAGSDVIPKDLFVIELSFAEIDRIQFSYNTFDSMDSVERNQEKLYGILQGPFKFTPDSPKIIKGQILSALNKACCFMFPDQWNQLSPKPNELPGQVGAFIDEIRVLDEVLTDAKAWDQALVCTALMALRRWGENERLIQGLTLINDGYMNTALTYKGKKKAKIWDGITKINDEWINGLKFPDKTTNWFKEGGMNNTVSFALYWLEKWMKDETGENTPKEYKEVAPNWRKKGAVDGLVVRDVTALV